MQLDWILFIITDNLLHNPASSVFAIEVLVETFFTNGSFVTRNYLIKFPLILYEVFWKILLETY